MPQRISRRLVAIASTMFAVAAIAPGTASAQHNVAGAAASADSTNVFIGTWEGQYTSDHAPAGAIKLVIAKDSILKMSSMALAMNNEMTPVTVHNFAVSPTDITWTLDMMGMTCQTTAILKEGQMKGTIVCAHASVTFSATKK
jgi:hypothetical protein